MIYRPTVKKLVLSAALLLFFLIALLPVVSVMVDSVIHDGRLSLESYRGLLAGERQRTLLWRSLALAAKTTLLSLAAGVPAGFFIQRDRIFLERFFRVVYLTPLMIPPHVHVVAWTALFGETGFINLFLVNLFSLEGPPVTIYTPSGATWVLGLTFFPVIALFTIAGLASVDPRLEEAGRICGARRRAFFRITLPLVTPYVLGGAILVFILAVSNYGVPSLLRVQTFPVEIMASYGAFYDAKAAVALSFPVLMVILSLVLLYHWIVGKKPFFTIGTHFRRQRPETTGFRRITGTGFVVLLMLVSTVVPVISLAAATGSIQAWVTALKTAHEQMAFSVLSSAAAATLATGLYFMVARAFESVAWLKAGWADFPAILPFALPGPVLAIGMIQVWNCPALDLIYGGMAIVVLAFTARFCPLSLKPIVANLGQIHPHMEEAARIVDGAWLRRVFRITGPLALPGLTASWIITYIFCMGELSVSLLVMPPGGATLSIRIYTLMHYGAGELVACLCLYLIFLTLVPVSLVLWVYRRLHGGGKGGHRLEAAA